MVLSLNMSSENAERKPKINLHENSREVRLGLEGVDGTTEPKDSVNLDELNNITRTSATDRVQPNDLDVNDSRSTRTTLKPVNYAARKTVAQGMMDIALLTSNANQLKNLIEYQSNSRMYLLVMVLICVSLILQIAVGVTLIFKGRFDSKLRNNSAASRVNKHIMTAVFLITVINIFIAAFSSGPPSENSSNFTTAAAAIN